MQVNINYTTSDGTEFKDEKDAYKHQTYLSLCKSYQKYPIMFMRDSSVNLADPILTWMRQHPELARSMLAHASGKPVIVG